MSVVQTIVFGLLTSNSIFIVPQIQNNTSLVNITLAHKLKSHEQIDCATN